MMPDAVDAPLIPEQGGEKEIRWMQVDVTSYWIAAPLCGNWNLRSQLWSGGALESSRGSVDERPSSGVDG